MDRAKIALNGKISLAKLSNNLQNLEVNGKQHMSLIGFHGTNLTVGHDELGDPRRTNGWLRERYFQEEEKPLCTITVSEGAIRA